MDGLGCSMGYGGFLKQGCPNSWMIYFMENPNITWKIWRYPHVSIFYVSGTNDSSIYQQFTKVFAWVLKHIQFYGSPSQLPEPVIWSKHGGPLLPPKMSDFRATQLQMAFNSGKIDTHSSESLPAWWLIQLSKWVITPVINGISRVNPLITGVITHLLSRMSHQVLTNRSLIKPSRSTLTPRSYRAHATRPLGSTFDESWRCHNCFGDPQVMNHGWLIGCATGGKFMWPSMARNLKNA